MKDYSVRIGGAWMGVKAPSPSAALLRAIKDYDYAIDAALAGEKSLVKASDTHKRVTISIQEI